MKEKFDQKKINTDDYFTIDDCLNWLSSNKYSNIGMEYTSRRIVKLINEFIEVENLPSESIEQELNESEYNAQIKMHDYIKSLESYLGDFKILINVTDENETYYTTDISIPPSQYAKTKAGVPRYLVNESFLRALDFYLEDFYFQNSSKIVFKASSSKIVFKASKDIFPEIIDFDKEQLISYVDTFIQDLLNIIKMDMIESLDILRNQEMARLNITLDKYRLMMDSPNDQIIDQCYFLMNKSKDTPIISNSLFDKFKVTICNDIDSNQNFENERENYSDRMNRFLRDYDKRYNSKADDKEYVLHNEEEFIMKLEKALKKREFRKYIDYFYIQSRLLRNKMNDEMKDK